MNMLHTQVERKAFLSGAKLLKGGPIFLHCVSPKYILEWSVVTVTLGHRILEMLLFGKDLRWESWRFAD